MNNISEEMVDRIHTMARRTWDVIGGDILRVTEEMGEEPILDRDEVVEAVCDAGYMLIQGDDKEAYHVWDELPFEQKIEVVRQAFPFSTYGW